MIRSMTGFGRGLATVDGAVLTVEIKTVNHRFCDIGIKAPRLFAACEAEIRRRVGDRLKRGKVDVHVAIEYAGGGATMPVLNRPLAEAYLQVLRELRGIDGVTGEISLGLVAGQRDVIHVRENVLGEDVLCPALFEALVKALDSVETMRTTEGESTRRDIAARLEILAEHLKAVTGRAPMVPLEWQGRLSERLARLGPDVAFDPARVAQEIVVFADRCDISEEICRFGSHLEQLRGLLDLPEPVGRQFDFLVQELNREANTMGSKSNDVELTRHVVSIKAELEKIREQVQNVE